MEKNDTTCPTNGLRFNFSKLEVDLFSFDDPPARTRRPRERWTTSTPPPTPVWPSVSLNFIPRRTSVGGEFCKLCSIYYVERVRNNCSRPVSSHHALISFFLSLTNVRRDGLGVSSVFCLLTRATRSTLRIGEKFGKAMKIGNLACQIGMAGAYLKRAQDGRKK